ncbi:uncharacterized protein PHALS_04428 [Plasmopara halstedii]|uniref:Uncharacterized protein n=1 Tax=Plasmopara halstedii TaxID=4781 RepID=A0A0P1B297_PLAHL|nr:uncharacterized protein PHALS_04428 [Plasmopara halstedii]CEG47560.1 hypothetical protein PHALS_04428 [Plasmopara halstedii]|eukprot:XP_024583929.1 hypothetical protein PHALS_04428 [Plasmopara halstedii]
MVLLKACSVKKATYFDEICKSDYRFKRTTCAHSTDGLGGASHIQHKSAVAMSKLIPTPLTSEWHLAVQAQLARLQARVYALLQLQ